MSEPEILRAHIDVPVPVDAAFATFTAHIGSWWPLADKNVLGPAASVALEGARVVERAGGRSCVWAEVVELDPPKRVRLDFHPEKEPEQATHLTVDFDTVDGGTRVTLEEQDWCGFGVHGVEEAEVVTRGWNEVLGAFATSVGRAAVPG